jgi:FtsP/CotA-like multicopper oxidase with cupredoxin domain
MPFIISAVLAATSLAAQLPTPIHSNFNDRPAGIRQHGVQTVRLEARRGVWHPEAETGAALPVEAFGEAGGPLLNPGPMIRVAAGTVVAASVRNAIPAETLVVHGLGTRPGNDSLIVLPGETRSVRFTAGEPGTYFYWGATTGRPLEKRRRRDSQLSGAFIIDPPGARPADRVFLIGVMVDSVDVGGHRELREVPTINGKMFPHLPEFTFAVGDTARWRWINASDRTHPMHLHGFYFDVNGRGDGARDTVYSASERRHVVTETLLSGATMDMAVAPERPGNWLFHCHVLFHVAPDLMLRPVTDSGRGAYEHMSGLTLLLHVRGRAAAQVTAAPRRLRLLVERGWHEFPGRDSVANGFVLTEGDDPAPGAIRVPGPPIVLTRGEPVAITVVNHLAEPTAVHWHGIELESYYDGVPGMSGEPGHLMPSIPAGDSFVVRFTPPRAGTFIYHTHIDDVRQLEGGLYGAIIVLEPGQTFDTATDHIVVISSYAEADSILWNGRHLADTLTLAAGTRERLRFVIIPAAGDAELAMLRDTTVLQWTPWAKDGRDLPDADRQPRPARAYVAVGETYDFAFTPEHADLLRFVIWAGPGGPIFYSAPVRVR